MLLSATSVFAQQATVTTELDFPGDNWWTPMSTFTMDVRVTNNTTPTSFPLSCNFRVTFPTDSVSFVGTVGGDLGTVFEGPVEVINASTSFIDILAAGENNNSSEPEPLCFSVEFEVTATPTFPYSIFVADDPDASRPLPANIVPTFPNIAHDFNTLNSENLMDLTSVPDWSIFDY
jgi:hypothetical protein